MNKGKQTQPSVDLETKLFNIEKVLFISCQNFEFL